MSYNAGKKTYTAVCQEKEFFHQRVEKKKLVHKPNHPHPPSKDKWSAPKLTMLRPAGRLCNLYIPLE